MLNAVILKEEILTSLEGKGFKRSEANDKFIECIVESIIEHIRQNAIVTTTVSTPSGAGSGIGSIK